MNTLEKIYQKWEEVGNKDKGHRLHLGASVLGDPCERKLWYIFRWASDVEFNGRMLRLFDRGQREENTFTKELTRAGVLVHDTKPGTNEQYRFSDISGHVGGSMDGWGNGFAETDEYCVIEYKTHSDKSFKTLQSQGVQSAKPLHYAQMQLYMYWSATHNGGNGMKKAFYLAVNKNDDELYSEFVDFDKNFAESLIEKAKRIVTANRAPARMTEDPSFYLCKWCEFSGTCHNDTIGAVNCRTCVHSTPIHEGKWKCEKNKQPLDEQRQRAACESHLFIPDLIPYAEAVDANPNENWVEYEKENGERFKNGTNGWPSIELVNLPVEMTNDDFLIKLRKQFDGKVVA